MGKKKKTEKPEEMKRQRKKIQGEGKKDNRVSENMTEVSAGGLFDQGRAVVILVSPVQFSHQC